MRVVKILSVVALGMAVTGAAWAASDDNTVAYRQANMKAIGGHMKSIGMILKGDVDQADQLAGHASALATTAALAEAAFKDKAMVEKSTALPAIWTDTTKFSADMDALKTESAKLAEVAAAGDMAAVGAQMQAVGKTCKSCHDDFRKKD